MEGREWVTVEEAALLFSRATTATASAACASSAAYVTELSGGGAGGLEARAAVAAAVVGELLALGISERRAVELWDIRADTPELVRRVAPEAADADRAAEAVRRACEGAPT